MARRPGAKGRPVKFIVNYPEPRGATADMLASGDVGEFAQAAEAAGFAGFSLTEHPIPSAKWLDGGGHQTIDPLVGLAFVAAMTRRIRLLTRGRWCFNLCTSARTTSTRITAMLEKHCVFN